MYFIICGKPRRRTGHHLQNVERTIDRILKKRRECILSSQITLRKGSGVAMGKGVARLCLPALILLESVHI